MLIQPDLELSSIRYSRRALQPFLTVRKQLRQEMIRARAKGRACHLDKGSTLLGPGLRFKNGSIQMPTEWTDHSRILRRQEKPAKPAYPRLVLWQGVRLKLLMPKQYRVK